MGFKKREITAINTHSKKLSSYLNDIIYAYSRWAPEDERGSDGYGTLEGLRAAIRKAGFSDVALRLPSGMYMYIALLVAPLDIAIASYTSKQF